MESDNFGQVGRTDQLSSHNVPYRQGKVTLTISLSLDKEVHFFGMDILIG